MKKLKDANLYNKKVLVRCDFNLPIERGGLITDDFRIKEALPTVELLVKEGAKVVLMSHLGDPVKKISFKEKGGLKKSFSRLFSRETLYPVYRKIKEDFKKTYFVNDCLGEKVKKKVDSLSSGEILVLENLRYYKEEEENDDDFAKALAEPFDIYINNAFSVSHREHASLCKITNFLPSYPGLLFEREVEVLSKIRDRVERPLVVIIGGAKLDSKIKTIEHFLDKADHILLGGKIANAFLIIRKMAFNLPWPEENIVEKLDRIDITSPKIHLPVDVIASSDSTGETYSRETGPGGVRKEEDILDIGSNTIEIYSEIIKEAKTIVWAGPLGLFEVEKFEKGTREIGNKVADNFDALKVVGGGDTSYMLKKFGLRGHIDHISLGGGALLSYLSSKEMPGLEALEKNK